MTFQVGEKVVYPNHGVGTIENISTRSFGSQFERFYLLRLTYKSMTVMVPFSHAQWLAGRIPGVTAWLTGGDGHLSLLAQVGRVHGWLLEH